MPRKEKNHPGEMADAGEYQLVNELRGYRPGDQRKAHLLGIRNLDEMTLLELWKFYTEDHFFTLNRGANLETKAASILVVLGLIGTVFLSSSSVVVKYISDYIVAMGAVSLLGLSGLAVFFSLRVTASRFYQRVFDGFLLNVKPRKGEGMPLGFDMKAVLQDESALERLLDPSFDRLAHLRKNLLNLVEVNAKNRALNWKKADWLTRTQVAFLVFLVVLVLMSGRIIMLEMKGAVPIPLQRGDLYSPWDH